MCISQVLDGEANNSGGGIIKPNVSGGGGTDDDINGNDRSLFDPWTLALLKPMSTALAPSPKSGRP